MDRPSSSCCGPFPVLPPIVSNERDRRFLVELNQWISDELSQLATDDIHQRYVVYKEAFSKVIDFVTAYRPLMTQIKSQYEEVIGVLERGQHEAFYLTGKLSEMVGAPGTLRNYQRRAQDLDSKLSIIESDNERLRQELVELQSLRADREQRRLAAAAATTVSATPVAKETTTDRKLKQIPGLSLENSTDIPTLTLELDKLDRQFRELNIACRTRYAPREQRDELRTRLNSRVADRDQLTAEVETLRQRDAKLRVAVDAAKSFLEFQLPHQTIGDAVLVALAKASQEADVTLTDEMQTCFDASETVPGEVDDTDSIADDRDADAMLDYIEKFNELLEEKLYHEAAVHAANSPRGILRTMETMQRFIDVSTRWRQSNNNVTEPSPLLTFCSALMSTVKAFSTRPDAAMCLQCVQCALDENRLDLISHWLSQDRLTLTEAVGNIIYRHPVQNPHTTQTCLSLAQKVYVDVGAHQCAMISMVRLGRITGMLQYAQRQHCTAQDLLQVLHKCPTRELARALSVSSSPCQPPVLPLGVVVTTLLETDLHGVGFDLLQELCVDARAAHDADSESQLQTLIAKDNKTSYEQWTDIVSRCRQHFASRPNSDCSTYLLTAVDMAFQPSLTTSLRHVQEDTALPPEQLSDRHHHRDDDHLPRDVEELVVEADNKAEAGN